MNESLARYMLFLSEGRRYAIDVNQVDELAERLPEYPLPNAPRFLRGMVNIHGKLATVLDISMYLGTGPARNGKNLLLLKMPKTGLALVIDQLERIICASDIITSEQGTAEFEKTVFTLSEGNATLLDIDILLASVEKAIAS